MSVSSGDSATIDNEELAGLVESVVSNEVLAVSDETTESVVVDTTNIENQLEQIHNDLVGVNNRLDILVMFVVAFFIWTVIRTVYKFFDSMF